MECNFLNFLLWDKLSIGKHSEGGELDDIDDRSGAQDPRMKDKE